MHALISTPPGDVVIESYNNSRPLVISDVLLLQGGGLDLLLPQRLRVPPLPALDLLLSLIFGFVIAIAIFDFVSAKTSHLVAACWRRFAHVSPNLLDLSLSLELRLSWTFLDRCVLREV